MSVLKQTLVYSVGPGNTSNDDDVLSSEPCFRGQFNAFSVTLSLAIDLRAACSSLSSFIGKTTERIW